VRDELQTSCARQRLQSVKVAKYETQFNCMFCLVRNMCLLSEQLQTLLQMSIQQTGGLPILLCNDPDTTSAIYMSMRLFSSNIQPWTSSWSSCWCAWWWW